MLLEHGLGKQPLRSDSLTDRDIDKFYQLKLLGNDNPFALLRTLHRNNIIYLGMRASKEHRDLRWGDVTCARDDKMSLRYLEYHRKGRAESVNNRIAANCQVGS